MAKMNASDVLVETLIDWGVEVVFGIPGDGINGIIEALRKRQDKVKFIQVRHEEAAAFAAVGYAKFTGKLGVCIATSGPGGIHLLNGLYDAKLDMQPVLAITGLQFHDLINTFTQQDVELDKLFMDPCVYNTRVMSASHVENAANLACRFAFARRGPAHITIPVDFQELPMEKKGRSERNVNHHTSSGQARSARLPDHDQLKIAAEILNAGERVAILAGRGALGAGEELEHVAELLGAPIIKALLGKAAIPDDSPYSMGGIGLLGTRPSQESLENCDTLFIIGSSFPYIEFLPRPGQAKCVQIELDPMRIGLRYPADVGLVGDAQNTLLQLIPLLKTRAEHKFLKQGQKLKREWDELMHGEAARMDMPMKPQVIASQIGKVLTDDAIVACDSGTIATWWARHIPAKKGQMHSCSGTLASMANGLPYAIAAAVAFPGRQVVAFVGDGGFSMLMAEFATCVKYKLPIKLVVVKNNALGQIKWEQMVMLGNPEYVCDLQPIDFVGIARACGGQGISIDDPKKCEEMVRGAFALDGPVLIEAVIDPFESPMPAKVTVKQAAHFAASLARGEPNREKIALTVLSDKVRQLL